MMVLVCGDRNWTDERTIINNLAILRWWLRFDTIIHGAARGADTIAGIAGQWLAFKVISVPAEWERYRMVGRKSPAGVIRNRKMLDMKPDLVLAFHLNIRESKGTKDCVEEANRRGIPTVVIDEIITNEREI